METFIQYKDKLLTQHEWNQGDSPNEKTLKARHKLVKKGEVRVITDEKDFEPVSEKREIVRKLFK